MWTDRLFHLVGEVVLRAFGVAGVEEHLTAGAAVGAGAAGDGERGIGGVEEGPFDGDLAVGQNDRPTALPGDTDLRADATPEITTDHGLIRLVIDLIAKR